MIFIDEDKCTGCGDCLQVCPEEGAIVFQRAKAVINHDLCTGCAACMPACPEGAIYEVEAALMVAEQAQPAQVTEQPAPGSGGTVSNEGDRRT
ncbi:MAG: 4Fe-4S binding protein [Dehalococcoidia bacterium]